MSSPRWPSPFAPLCGERGAPAPRSPEADALWRRAEFGLALRYVGLFAVVAAGFFAVVGLPIPAVEPPSLGVVVPEISLDFVPLSVWLVRFAAVLGLVLHSVGTFLDQHYSGEDIARGEGEGSRGEVVASSVFSAVVAAALTLLIVLLYRGA